MGFMRSLFVSVLAVGAMFALGGAPARAQAPSIALFQDDNFQGSTRSFNGPVQNLQAVGFNDVASSVIVYSGTWALCDQENFRHPCITLGPGRYPQLSAYNMNDKISSLRPINRSGYNGGGYDGGGYNGGGNNGGGYNGGGNNGGGYNGNPNGPNYGNTPVYGGGPDGSAGIILFQGENFQGNSRSFTGAAPNLQYYSFNDQANSIIIYYGRWQVCDQENFGSPCTVLGPGQYPRLANMNFSNIISSLRPL